MNLKDERGFYAGITLIFLATLTLMTLGVFVLFKSEGSTFSNQLTAMQADYAANGAVYYALSALENDNFSESGSLTIGGATVTMDTFVVSSSVIGLSVIASQGDIQITTSLQLSLSGTDNVAIWATGTVDGISVFDSTGSLDDALVMQNLDSIPSIDKATLMSVASSQGHFVNSDFTPSSGYPGSSFYYSAGVPNVTYVNGDLTVRAGRTVRGIFVVDGDVRLQASFFSGTGKVEGILCLTESSNDVSMDVLTRVTGGIFCNGDVSKSGFFSGMVYHVPAYMRAIEPYVSGTGSDATANVLAWTYE